MYAHKTQAVNIPATKSALYATTLLKKPSNELNTLKEKKQILV